MPVIDFRSADEFFDHTGEKLLLLARVRLLILGHRTSVKLLTLCRNL